MAEIIFRADFPQMVYNRAASILNEFAWLHPVWLQKLYVSFHADDRESSAYITVETDYRFASLTICGHWVTETEGVQREQITHELVHMHNVPVKYYASEMFDALCRDEDKERLLPIIKNELRSKNEQSTQDLTMAIINRFKS